ncbi:MAG: YafY family transcriptional regulator [Clostridiales bacterium]|nr:YafY family transcriptional regulator [Clostridiales bacterium]
MKIQRLLGILCVLTNTDKITIQELAQRFEVSKRTIFRDLDTLNCAGIPIVTYPGIGGGVSIIEGYKIDNRVLSADDTEKVFTALNGLKSIDGDTAITNLIAKLAPEKESKLFSQSQYVINLSSWFSDSTTKEKVMALSQAIQNRHCIHLEYISKQSRSMRIVEPHKLVFRQSQWYLYAFCRKRNDFRLFKLRRIVRYEELEAQFTMRQISSIEFKNDYGTNLFSDKCKEGMFQVILEYDISAEFGLTDKIDACFFEKNVNSETQLREIRFFASDLLWTANFVMGIIDKVRVVSPPELYEEVKRRINKINSHYKG